MRISPLRLAPAFLAVVAGCSSDPAVVSTPPMTAPDAAEGVETGTGDGAPGDSATPLVEAGDGGGDAGMSLDCSWGGAPGQCMTVSACAAIQDHTSYAGKCAGPSDIQCCIRTPSTADNPPIPVGYKLMQQSQVTPDMTTWAVSILNDPVTYPMFATTTKPFGTLLVLARVEWHPPDFQNAAVHRGVTLYVPG